MFDTISRENQLMIWAGKLLSEDEWMLLEKITNELVVGGVQEPSSHCGRD